jgi:hypothetical protein
MALEKYEPSTKTQAAEKSAADLRAKLNEIDKSLEKIKNENTLAME